MLRRLIIGFLFLGAAVVVFMAVTNVSIYLASKPYLYDTASSTPYAEVALVPGAPVFEERGTLTPIFKDRVDAALRLYESKKVSKILVSGDNRDAQHNEVNPAREYLLLKGVPEGDILLDSAGFDTYSSMFRAKEIFGISSIIVTTQSFHLPRAVFIARALGIEAYGLSADVGSVLFQNYVREAFANEKALFDLIFHAKATYP